MPLSGNVKRRALSVCVCVRVCACLPEVGQWDLDQSGNFGQNFGQLTSRITVFQEPVLKFGLGSLFSTPLPRMTKLLCQKNEGP